MENKVCSKCNIAKTIDNFRVKKNGYIFTVCKDCEYKENMERYYRKKMSNPKYVENKKIEIENIELKEQGLKKCMVCKQIKQLSIIENVMNIFFILNSFSFSWSFRLRNSSVITLYASLTISSYTSARLTTPTGIV